MEGGNKIFEWKVLFSCSPVLRANRNKLKCGGSQCLIMMECVLENSEIIDYPTNISYYLITYSLPGMVQIVL